MEKPTDTTNTGAAQALTTPSGSEREAIRAENADKVMPIIGPLMDAWENLPRDVADMEELDCLSGYLEQIRSIMESNG